VNKLETNTLTVDELLADIRAMLATSGCPNELTETATDVPAVDEIFAEYRASDYDDPATDETPDKVEYFTTDDMGALNEAADVADKPEPHVAVESAAADTFPKKRRAGKILFSILFYIILAAAIAAAFLYGAKPGARNFLGFSYANVLTRSMQSEIPQGSLVLVKHVDPATIKVGDVVTYIRPDNITVTHKVMTIYEDYYQSGVRGFVTKGVDNPDSDPDVVYADNVIGVVQFHIANAGAILSDISNHIWVIAGIFIVLLMLSVTLKMFFSESKREKARKEHPPKHMRRITS